MAGQIRAERSGARTVELLMPFDFQGIKVEAITLGPIVLDHTLRWKQAKFEDWFALMVEVATINDKPARGDDLRQLRYPDADRVVQNFLEILPLDIRAAVQSGTWPTREPPPMQEGDGQAASDAPPDLSRMFGHADVPAADPMSVDD